MRIFSKAKKISVLLTVLILLFSLSSSALALNSTDYFGDENKPLNFLGYKYVNPTHLDIYFDRYMPLSFSTEQLTISLRNSPFTQIPVSSMSYQSGDGFSGISGPGIKYGSTFHLTLAFPLAYNTSYDFTLANTIPAESGISLGNYINREDFSFEFKTPDSNGNYTGEPRITFWPTSREEVAYEGNITLIVDRPVAQSSISSVLSGLSSDFLKENNQVIQDTIVDGTSVPGAETYRPFANDAGTAFTFPLTVSNEDFYFSVYNLTYDSGTHEYSLEVPEFDDVSGNHYDDKDILNFTTYEEDLVGWLDNTPTVGTITNNSITINWSESTIAPFADSYDIYYSTSAPYNGFSYVDTVFAGDNQYSYVIGSLSSSTTYYFRIIPVFNLREAGFSPFVAATTL